MEIRTAYTFLKVASTQNFSKAAQELGYSQSAVTIQIQNLERELGVPLFERIGKRAYLTEKGREFIGYADEFIRSYQNALNFDKAEKGTGGKLRIGGVESVCTALLPKLLPEFYKKCPDVEVMIRSGITEDLIKLLDSNQLDIVFTLDEKIYRSDLKFEKGREEDIILVSMNKNKRAVTSVVPLVKLCSEPFVLTERGAPYRHELEKVLAQRDLEIRPILEIGNTETIINLLKKGIGISFLPRFTVADDLKSGELAEIKSDFSDVKMYLQLLYHKNKWITGQMEIFIDLVNEYIEKTAV